LQPQTCRLKSGEISEVGFNENPALPLSCCNAAVFCSIFVTASNSLTNGGSEAFLVAFGIHYAPVVLKVEMGAKGGDLP